MLQPRKYLTQYAQFSFICPCLFERELQGDLKITPKEKKIKTMPCAVVLLEFQHNPEEHFSFIPLQNDGMHIAETLRQEGHVNV